jgi:hypothetical protein
MPYITKDQITSKRNQLKKALPQYKLSVTNSNYSGINVSIVAGPNDLGHEYNQLNEYNPGWYNEEVQSLLSIIMPILNEDKGEATHDGDYGSIPGFYTWVQIGKWDKPYEIKAK